MTEEQVRARRHRGRRHRRPSVRDLPEIFFCGDPHGVSERLSAASPKNFYFFVLRPAARFAENAFFGSAFFHKGRAFFFAPAAAVQRERFLRPAEKTMQLSALQYDSFHVSKFVIQTEKQDFF